MVSWPDLSIYMMAINKGNGKNPGLDSNRRLVNLIEKICWFFAIGCVIIASIFKRTDVILGILAGFLITLYNFKYLCLSLDKLFGGKSEKVKVGWLDAFHFVRLLVLGLLLYFALVYLRVSALGLVGGVVLVVTVILSCGIYWFGKEDFTNNA